MLLQHMIDLRPSLLFRDWQCRLNVISYWDSRILPKRQQGNCTSCFFNSLIDYCALSLTGVLVGEGIKGKVSLASLSLSLFPQSCSAPSGNSFPPEGSGLQSCLTGSCIHCLRFWLLLWGLWSHFIGLHEHPTVPPDILCGLSVVVVFTHCLLFCFPRPVAFIAPECDIACTLLVKIK